MVRISSLSELLDQALVSLIGTSESVQSSVKQLVLFRNMCVNDPLLKQFGAYVVSVVHNGLVQILCGTEDVTQGHTHAIKCSTNEVDPQPQFNFLTHRIACSSCKSWFCFFIQQIDIRTLPNRGFFFSENQ